MNSVLTFEAKGGRPLAMIVDGKDKRKKKILYLSENKENIIPIESKVMDDMDEALLKKMIKKISKGDARILRNALRLEVRPDDDTLGKIYDKLTNDNKEKSMKEYNIHDNSILQVLPNFEKTERLYICGPTDSGKSFYSKQYITNFVKIFPKKKIYLFSDVQKDPQLDSLPNLIRFLLDDELIEKEIHPEIFQDSLCIFDDIDSIQNPKLLKKISSLRDSLIVRGRHENIYVICTSHLMTNYRDTRIILSNCGAITFFPKSGCFEPISYTLKHYCGLNKQQIQKMMNVPSRWCTIIKTFPQICLHEKGAWIL